MENTIVGSSSSIVQKNGIVMVKTIPGTPQQNGVAERMNRTLCERARSMRLHSGLPEMFWAEAVSTAAYLINRSPSTPLDFKLPEEVWSDKQVNLSHLKVFGCVSYVHVNAADRSKLDAKSTKCYFIGYGGAEIGYRFWDDQNRKIIRSKDVIFNEQVLYKNRAEIEAGGSEIDGKSTEVIQLEDLPEIETETAEVEVQNSIAPETEVIETNRFQQLPLQLLEDLAEVLDHHRGILLHLTIFY